MKADVGEGADEVEQHAEADGVGRQQPGIAQMRQHLPARSGEIAGAHEALLRFEQQGHDDKTDHGQAGEREEAAAPADIVGEHAGNEAA